MWLFIVASSYVVRIYADGQDALVKAQDLVAMGLDDIVLIVEGKKSSFIDVVVSKAQLSILEKNGYTYIIRESSANLDGLVDFGPYYTYSEAYSAISSIHDAYPSLVSEPFSIGTSWENRDIWAIRVGADSSLHKPVFWLNNAIHAREPGGVSVGIGFVDFLTKMYGRSPEITYLLDNRTFYYIPVTNPDGYTYNEVSDGYWRKNKRDNNNDGQFSEDDDGVDLNRNFGYMWGADDQGSSPDPTSPIYRGPAPFSEPETQAYREFFNAVQPTIALDMHTYSNLILWPWGYTSDPTPQDTIYRFLAWRMFRHNAYVSYQSYHLYPTNGTTDDWIHGATDEHPLALGWTFEVGEEFWQPDTNIILEQIGENIFPLLDLLKASGPYIEIDDLDYTFSGDTVFISISGKNIGFGFNLNSLTATISVPSTFGTVIDGTEDLGDVAAAPDGYFSATNAFAILVKSFFPYKNLPIEITFSTPDGFSQNIPLFVAEKLDTLFYDDFDTDLSQWTVSGSNVWGIYNGNLTESPYGDYSNNLNTSIRLADPLDVSDYSMVKLIIVHKWNIEGSSYNSLDEVCNSSWFAADCDWASIEVNTSYLENLWPVLQRYWATQSSYITQEFDLTQFKDTALNIRFKFNSNSSQVYDGWNIDKVLIVGAKPYYFIGNYEPVESQFGHVVITGKDGLYNISVPYNSPVDVKVFNAGGRLILSDRIEGQGTLDMRRFSEGVYIIKASTNRETVTKKILVR